MVDFLIDVVKLYLDSSGKKEGVSQDYVFTDELYETMSLDYTYIECVISLIINVQYVLYERTLLTNGYMYSMQLL